MVLRHCGTYWICVNSWVTLPLSPLDKRFNKLMFNELERFSFSLQPKIRPIRLL